MEQANGSGTVRSFIVCTPKDRTASGSSDTHFLFLGLKIAKIFPHNPSFQQCRHLCSLGLFCLGIFFGNAVAGVLGNIFCCYFVFFPHTPNFQVFAPAIAQTLHIELLLLSS